jgi:two-component system OmpR family sensor kinase
MMNSLRARLFVGLTAVILLAGGIGGMLTYNWAYNEAIEMQDSLLTQIGGILQNGSLKSDQSLPGIDDDAEVMVEELGKVLGGSAEDRQLWSFQDGLHMAARKAQPVRVLLRTRPDGSRFAVSQPAAVRDETAGNMALRTVLPIAALIPCLLLVTAVVIGRSLRPMVRMAGDLDSTPANDLTPLPLVGTPGELHPFIASINALLARVKVMMDQQRRFVADAAHELRTPITALSLQAENLDSLHLPQEARERLATLKQGMARTKHLLDQLLALSRHEICSSADGTVVQLDDAVRLVVADLLPLAGRKGIDLGFELIEPVATRGEPVMIATMIRNLMENALRFTPCGGRVDVGVYREGNSSVLQIEDSGPGIPPSDLDRIFDPFVRGRQSVEEGTGLGLSIVKRIIDGLGGTILLENLSGPASMGLRATVRLPASIDSSTVSAPAP